MTARAVRMIGPFSKGAPLLQPRTQRCLLKNTIFRSISTAPTMQPKIASGQDVDKVKAELEELVDGGWQLDDKEIQLEKTYHLSSYRSVKFLALEIMSRSQLKNHHPVLIIKFSSVTVYWTTHSPFGLSEKDTFMAKYCDGVVKSIGTVDPEETKKCGSAHPSQI